MQLLDWSAESISFAITFWRVKLEDLQQLFDTRISEIESYLDLLAAVEEQVREGPPKLGVEGATISPTQQKILYSSVYLQLYNLVEATVTKCIEAVCASVAGESRWRPGDLSEELRREWVRYTACTHSDLAYDNRLARSLVLCDHLVNALPVDTLRIDKGGGGNWDDEEIYRLASRLGCNLAISADSNEAVKQPFRNELGALALVVKLRNDLAHGSVSFVECGDAVTVSELRELKSRAERYLREVVSSFRNFVEGYGFLTPALRAIEVGA